MNYHLARRISGPAYAPPFKIGATVLILGLLAYGLSVVARFPIGKFSPGTQWMLGMSALMLVTSYWFFVNAQVTVDESGIRQTWIFDKKIAWQDVRSVRLLGLPGLHRLFPPRLMVRTRTNFFLTFHGGSPELLQEYARIVLAFQNSPGS